MMLNLTQHMATPEQKQAGVVDLPAEARAMLFGCLTVNELPSKEEIFQRCESIAALAASLASPDDRDDGNPGFAFEAMIGGAPWMMSALEDALRQQGIEPRYSFSKRVSVEKALPDGSVVKEAVFRHQGFI